MAIGHPLSEGMTIISWTLCRSDPVIMRPNWKEDVLNILSFLAFIRRISIEKVGSVQFKMLFLEILA